MKNYYELVLNGHEGRGVNIALRDQYGDPIGGNIKVIGELIDGHMYEIITGREIVFCDSKSVCRGLSYCSKSEASYKDIIELRNTLNKELYIGYIQGLNYLIRKNNRLYDEFLMAEYDVKNFRKTLK